MKTALIILTTCFVTILLTACGGGEGEDEAPAKTISPVEQQYPGYCGTTHPSPPECNRAVPVKG